MPRRGKDGLIRKERNEYEDAVKQYRKDVRRAEITCQVVAGVTQERVQQIESVPIGRYSQGVLIFSLVAGGIAYTDLCTAVRMAQINDGDSFSPETEALVGLADAGLHLGAWERATRVSMWSYWRETMSGFSDYIEEGDKAILALPPLSPHELEVPLLGRQEVWLDDLYRVVLTQMHLAGVGAAPAEPAIDTLLDAWHEAWLNGWGVFRYEYERAFPETGWPWEEGMLAEVTALDLRAVSPD